MKKINLKSNLFAPVIIGAFLSSNLVFADETVTIPLNEATDLVVESSDNNEKLSDLSIVSSNTAPSDSEIESPTLINVNNKSDISNNESEDSLSHNDELEAVQPGIDSASSQDSVSEGKDSIVTGESAQNTNNSQEFASVLKPFQEDNVLKVNQENSKLEVERQALVTAVLDNKGISIQYNATIATNESIRFAVWSEINGQDDIVWYTADSSGSAYVQLSKHKDYGLYNIHTYSFVADSKPNGLNAMTITVAKPDVQTSVMKTGIGNYEIIIDNVPETITSILVPVWSEKNGQDDIKWYQAINVSSGTYRVNVSIKDHKNDYGHYNAHIYGMSTVTGGLVGLTTTSGFDNVDSRSNAVISMVNYAENKTSFDVVVAGSDTTKDITGVSIAVWSEDNGQDDIKWYVPAIIGNTATTIVNISNHSNTSDFYNVHVYVDYADGTRVGTVLGSYKITKPANINNVTSQLTKEGIGIALNSNVVKDYTKVKFAVWSDVNGQDDIVWYDANTNGTAIARYEKHSGYGVYNIHAYSFESGKAVGLSAATVTIARPDIKTTISKSVKENNYEIIVENVPLYISSVTLPVWSDINGQDDIKWTTATEQSDGTYIGLVSVKNHNFDTGHYSVHIYGKSKIGNQLLGLGVTEGFTVEREEVVVTAPEIIVTNYNKDKGILTVTVSETETSRSIKAIQVAAWSEESQTNIYWYISSDVKNGQVSVTINEKNHKYIQGDYTIHAYVDFKDNTRSGYVVGNYVLNAEKVGSASQGNYNVFNKIIYLDAGHGGSDPGAVYFDKNEKDLNLVMQGLVKSRLESAGYTVLTTRTTDASVELLDRSKKVNASDSDIFVSIHFNAGASTASGIETYYYEYYSEYPSSINQNYHNNGTRLSMSSELAKSIQSSVVSLTGAKNNGVKRNTFAVLRETTAPAVLLELGYMSNPSEFQSISSKAYQEKLADGIISGILSYYKIYDV